MSPVSVVQRVLTPRKGVTPPGAGFRTTSAPELPARRGVPLPRTTWISVCRPLQVRSLPWLDITYSYLRSPVGRGVPDIALQSEKYPILWNGKLTETDGTGFSTNVRPTPLHNLANLLHPTEPQCTDRSGYHRAA